MLNGIDVYAGTGAIEWHRVEEAATAFVFVRAAYGITADKAAGPNLAAARSVGLRCGVYHFLRATLDYDAQLNLMLAQLQNLHVGPGDLPPVLDVEDNPGYDGPWNNANNAAYLAAVHKWIDAVGNKTGAAPIIYTRASFWSQIGNPKGFETCPLWVASYGTSTPHLPAGWTNYSFWQYSDSGAVPGINGHVDMNRFQGDATQLSQLLLK